LTEIVGLAKGDVALVEKDHVDVVPGEALARLTRAGLRLVKARNDSSGSRNRGDDP
jgi:hypothetical protein